MKKVRRVIGMVILLCYIMGKPVCAAEEPSFLYAKSAVLLDAVSGRVLYGKAETEVLPMASTTKIMTCILALEHGDLDDVVEISKYAASMPKVHLGVRNGEKYLLKDLLYSLMLESHNDVAVAIAEHISGSVEAFADLMNKKAVEIGCKNTHFVTPNGLDGISHDGKIHSTTAEELAKIMSYCILQSEQKDMFLKITQTANYSFSEQGQKRHFNCQNHNALLSMMPDAISGKTGYTSKAGYCYVGAVENDGRIFVVALLACGWPNHKTYKWSDCKSLFTYGKDTFFYKSTEDVKPLIKYPGRILVENAKGTEFGNKVYGKVIRREASKDISLLVKNEEIWEVSVEMLPKVSAPAQEGDVVGQVLYEMDGTIYKSDEIILAENVEALNFKHCVFRIIDKFCAFK